MREKDVHEWIEQQNPEAKQRLWERILKELQEKYPGENFTSSRVLDKRKKKRGKK